MTHTFKCHNCLRELSVSDKVFDERIAGKRVSVKCKHCNTPLTENDTSQNSTVTAASLSATEPGAPQREVTHSASTHPAPTKPTLTATARGHRNPSPDTALATTVKPSLTPVTAPPRPRHEDPTLAQNGNATRAVPPRRASSTSMAAQLSSATVVPASPRLATRPQLPTRGDDPNDIQQLLVVTPLPSVSSSPTVPLAPMPIVSVGRDATTIQSPAAPSASSTPLPTTVVASALAPTSQSSAESPASAASRDSENEMTPPATALAPDAELPQSIQPDVRIVAPMLLSKQRGARWMILGGAATLLVVALTFGIGLPKQGSPLGASKSVPPSAAVHDIARSTGAPLAPLPQAVVPAAVIATVSAVPTVVASAETPATTQEEKQSAVASPSLRVAPDANGHAASEDTIPDYVSKPTLMLVTDVAIRRAQRCHPHGHAAGTARLFITLAPSGRVSDVRIEGEPVASAPVAGCILGRTRSIQIAKFEGAPFTYTRSITMH